MAVRLGATSESGHYKAYVRSGTTNWTILDDAQAPVTMGRFVKNLENVYLMLFQKV